MTEKAIARTLFLSLDQVRYAKKAVYRKLRIPTRAKGCSMALAVARAWRSGLIFPWEVEGGPIPPEELSRWEIEESILSYQPADEPVESWPELRERCSRIANAVRSAQPSRHRYGGTAG